MGSEILICLTALVAGILFACKVPGDHLLGYLVPLILAAIASVLWRFKPFSFRPRQLAFLLIGFPSLFFAGWILVSTNYFHPGKSTTGQSEIIAKVVSYRQVSEKSAQLVVRVRQERVNGIWEKRTGKIVFMIKPGTNTNIYVVGDTWRFGPVTIKAVSPFPAKNGFIPSRYWLSRGVRYEAWLSAGKGSLLVKNRLPSLKGYFLSWQQSLAERINRMPLSEPSRSLLKAMVLGDRTDVADTTINDFSRAGIIHVLSVSGLHVGIIYFLVSWLVRRIRFVGSLFQSTLVLLVVWLYAGVTGFSPSALRSAGMISLFEFARVGRRGTPGLQVLGSAAIIHCLVDPYTIFGAGAQLSYLAVAGIFLWNPVFNPILTRMGRIPRYFAGTIAISLSAQCLIIPVLLFWFGWFPLYFLLGNLFLLPLMILGFYLGLLITLFDFAGLYIPLTGKGMDFLIDVAMKGAGLLGNLPGNLFEPEGLVWSDLVLYFFVLLMGRSYWDNPDPNKIKRLLVGTGLIFLARYATSCRLLT